MGGNTPTSATKMSLPKIASEGISIVLVGSFNPGIFQPAWFAAQDLIRSEEADEAEIELVRPEISAFRLEWLHMQVLHERFIATTDRTASFEVLRDFVVGTFSVLEHTPVTKLGLNYDRHFEMKSEEAWHKLGRRLAPRSHWEQGLKEPGLRSMTMQGVRPDELGGAIFVKVEPSVKVKFGVYVSLNDHYELGQADEGLASAETATQLIQEHWDAFLERNEQICRTLFEADE